MRLALVAAVWVVGCHFEAGRLASDADPGPAPGDARRDAPSDPPGDAAPPVDARVCPPAPSGCSLFTCAGSSSCYYTCGTTSQTKSNWAGAASACTNGNLGCLVTINDQAEQDCIAQNTLPSYSSVVWFGYHQTSKVDEPLGNWAWECGSSTFTQAPWGSGLFGAEPNNAFGREDCAAMTSFGGWFDADCGGTARYVCELP